ncbi:MAG: hypothetical protein IPL79_01530 [Myxococcales bacterium]|nr:hypothetical protein [Myxococcales bacterium]
MKQLVFGWAIVCLLAAQSVEVAAAPPPLFPLAQVKRGQQGYGLTTFAGSTPEKFSIEVVSVMHNFLPKMDIILLKSSDPKLAVSGFWRGMSGSPIFVDNKLMCAFSYGFQFNKVAFGGCTPIAYMLEEGFVTPRGTGVGAVDGPGISRSPTAAMGRLEFGQQMLATATSAPIAAASPAAPSPARPTVEGYYASVPLSISGASDGAFAYLQDALAPYNVTPMRAGGGGGTGSETGPTAFTMGGPISVIMIRGDMSAAGTGTVSYIDGDRVLAFGHPMFQSGEAYAPVATAEVHAVVAAASFPFVLASPQREIGALLQDRQSMIMADTRFRSAMLPVGIEISLPASGGKRLTKTFNVEVMQDPSMTASLAAAATVSALELYVPDIGDVVLKIESTLQLRGLPPLTFVDWTYSATGAADALIAFRALRLISPLMRNPFIKVPIAGLSIKASVEFSSEASEIYDMRVSGGMLIAGEKNWVEVLSRGKYDKLYTDRVAVEIPAHLAGSQIALEVLPGGRVAPDVPAPADAASLYAFLRGFVPGTQLVVNISSPTEGATLDGIVVRDLPASVADKLAPLTSTRALAPFRSVYRSTAPSPRPMMGSAALLLRVAPRR